MLANNETPFFFLPKSEKKRIHSTHKPTLKHEQVFRWIVSMPAKYSRESKFDLRKLMYSHGLKIQTLMSWKILLVGISNALAPWSLPAPYTESDNKRNRKNVGSNEGYYN